MLGFGNPPPTEFVSLTQATPLFFCSQSLQHVSDLHKKSQFHVFHPQNKRKVFWGKPINRFCGILGGKMGRNLGQVAEGEARLRVVQGEDVRMRKMRRTRGGGGHKGTRSTRQEKQRVCKEHDAKRARKINKKKKDLQRAKSKGFAKKCARNAKNLERAQCQEQDAKDLQRP